MGTINKVFLYNGIPQNGAIAQLWKITAFAAYADSTATVQDNPLNATDVECLTSNGAVFAVGDIIRMGTEYCLIWAKSGNTIYIIRGWHQSTPAQHNQNVVIYDEAVTPPVVDDAVPGAGQQGGNITTGVAYGGDGAYRFDAVPEMEYYASVTYDAHITYVHCFVERNDITPEQILLVDGDILIRNADTITRLPKGAAGTLLTMGADRPQWSAVAEGATKENWYPVTFATVMFALGDFPTGECNADNDFAYVSFKVPHDFTIITSAEFVIISNFTNANGDFDLTSDYGPAGGAYNASSEADTELDDVVQNDIEVIDTSGVLSAIAADDYVGVRIVRGAAGHNFYALGIKFKYT